jgi:hypothetical protein
MDTVVRRGVSPSPSRASRAASTVSQPSRIGSGFLQWERMLWQVPGELVLHHEQPCLRQLWQSWFFLQLKKPPPSATLPPTTEERGLAFLQSTPAAPAPA